MSAADPLVQLQALATEAGKDDSGLFADDLPEEFELIEEGDYTQDHKYQFCKDIVQHKLTGRYFAIENSRSGSYHSDWYYSTPEVREVERQVKVVETVVWAPVTAAAVESEGGEAD